MDDSKIFSERVKEVRKQKDWTQAELAERANITAAAISQFEAGTRLPTLPILQQLAGALDVSLDYLVGKVDNPKEFEVQDKWQSFFRKYESLSTKDRDKIEEYLSFMASKDKHETSR